MAAVTAAQVHRSLADALNIADESALPPRWDGIIDEAVTFSANEVSGVLESRGFSVANVAAWDRLFEVTRDLALWRTIVMGGIYNSFDANVIKTLDRRAELHTILVAVNGIYLKPALADAGMAATGGALADDGTATFTYKGGKDNEPHYGIHW